jgi:hypothetical protein
MRVGGVQMRDSGVVVVWWVGAGEHRAVLPLAATARADLVDRLLERLPGAAALEESLRLKQGVVAEPGQPVAVKASGFDQWFGLVRPFVLGDVDASGAGVVLTAVVEGVRLTV